MNAIRKAKDRVTRSRKEEIKTFLFKNNIPEILRNLVINYNKGEKSIK